MNPSDIKIFAERPSLGSADVIMPKVPGTTSYSNVSSKIESRNKKKRQAGQEPTLDLKTPQTLLPPKRDATITPDYAVNSIPPSTGKRQIGLAKLPASISTTEPRQRHKENDPVNYIGTVDDVKPDTGKVRNRQLNNVRSNRAISVEAAGSAPTNINISR